MGAVRVEQCLRMTRDDKCAVRMLRANCMPELDARVVGYAAQDKREPSQEWIGWCRDRGERRLQTTEVSRGISALMGLLDHLAEYLLRGRELRDRTLKRSVEQTPHGAEYTPR